MKDHKQVFHFTPALDTHLKETHRQLSSEEKKFLAAARDLYQVAVRSMGKALEDHHPLLHSVHLPPGGEQNHHLRFVSYDAAAPGTTIAKGHYDQSTLTIALCESASGLRLGTRPDTLAAYQRDPNQSVMFTGYGWLHLHRQLGIAAEHVPTWHDVVMPPVAPADQLGRAAIILFANPAYLDTTPSATETATPLTENTLARFVSAGILKAASPAAA